MTNQKQTKALKYMFATAMILSQMQAMTPVQAVSTDIQKQVPLLFLPTRPKNHSPV